MVMWTRREALAAGVAWAGLSLLPGLGARASEEVVALDWPDLVPEGAGDLPPSLRSLLPHDESAGGPGAQPASPGVRTDWNGRIVSLSGFVLPLDYAGTAITAFLLVPYVGACVHVPPPPAHQLVLVTCPEPYEADGLWAPVTVTGMFGTAATSTQLAEVGYALSADRIERYRA